MELPMQEQPGAFLFYTSPEGEVHIEVFFQDENVWLSQKKMAELFGVDVRTINEHVQNIYRNNELSEGATIRKFRIVQNEGGREVQRETQFYNLDMIISVGYRVNSARATQFRIWATTTLREYLIKGFAIDEVRLKNGSHFGKDYFEQLLETIREIRASERRFYQKITDIYAQCSTDYDAKADITQVFYKTVQNKLHWAITRHTAAELIYDRADATKPHMGLTTWKQAPHGKVLKLDVSVAKNYLQKDEMRDLNRIVSMYLDYAELQAQRRVPMTMEDWVKRLDAFLQFNDYEILNDAGRISHEVAKKLAETEYEKFRVEQDKAFESDFDKETKKYLKKNHGE